MKVNVYEVLSTVPGMGQAFGDGDDEEEEEDCYHYYHILENLCCCSVAKSCHTLCDPMNCSTPGFLVLQYLLEFAQIHVCRVGDAIEPFQPLPPSSPPPAFTLSQHQHLF